MAKINLKGGEYLIVDVACEDVFTPEEFTDEQKQIGETTEQFIVNEIIPHIEEIDKQNFDLVVQGMQKCGELGLLMMESPEEYGGLDLDKATTMLVGEKIAMGGSFSVAFAAHSGIGTLPLIYYGTPAQKEKYLEKITSGEWCAAYCLTEPGSGSDALGAQASAVLSEDGSHYVLNGTKQFIT
ncbi:MAG TPA: acyl-CoA dehydrogenase family protein, partial [Desulfopila sp.]|nr:acyl-CoA dehydrogenase family protein [Desulfopila sp.]